MTTAIWTAIERPWRTILAPILTSGLRSVVSDQILDLLRERLGAQEGLQVVRERVQDSRVLFTAFARQWCLVPADAFYEWQVTGDSKQPYAAARQDGQPMAFAGLWDGWRGPDGEVVRSFAIIVTDANATMAPIHDRMPVILEPADWPAWLGEAEGDPGALLRPAGGDVLRVWPVSRAVNSPRNNGPELRNPIEVVRAGGR